MCTPYIDDLWNKRMYPKWLKLVDPEYEGCRIYYVDMPMWQEARELAIHWHSLKAVCQEGRLE